MLFDFTSKLQNPNVVEKSNVVKKTLQKIVNSRKTCIQIIKNALHFIYFMNI